jgi:transcriptional repressor NrdR
MKCPFCENEEMIVTNSRQTFKGYSTWRRKKCIHCLNTFTTYEEINLNYIIVKKKDSSKERYSHYKLFSSILNSLMKMKNVDTGDCAKKAEKYTNEVEKILVKEKFKEIITAEIFNITLDILTKKDIRAAMNYFSYPFREKKNEEVEKLFQNYISKSKH